jgi:hypothetical protein
MDAENKNNVFKILVGVLSLLLIVLAVYTIKLYNDSKDTAIILQEQKADIETELEDLIDNYNQVIEDNDITDKELLAARERIVILLDSVKGAESNVSLLRRYKGEIKRLKNERVLLLKKADSMIASNKLLVAERDNTYLVLNETNKKMDAVSEENRAMAEKIKMASIVAVVDLTPSAVIIRKNGKIIDTKRANRAKKIRACFTLAPNNVAEAGNRKLYVQVINPKNNLLGDKEELVFENGVLNYSTMTQVYYENDELDVCAIVNAKEEDIIKGNYTINVFDGSNLVATSTMALK